MRGKGVVTVRDPRKGDLFAQVQVETPVNLTSEQKSLLEQFEKALRAGGTSKKTHDPKASSWLDSVKRFFENIGQ